MNVKSVTIKAAWISVGGVIVAAIIYVVLPIFIKSPDPKSQNLNNLGNAAQGNLINVTGNNAIITVATVPNTETKQAIADLQRKIDSTDENVNLTKKDLESLKRALEELDQRTSGITRLPDGRSQVGQILTGGPDLLLKEHNEAIKNFNNHAYGEALKHSENAIKLYEESQEIIRKSPPSMSMGSLDNKDVKKIYMLASLSALNLNENEVANLYAKKAMQIFPDTEGKAILANTLYNLKKYSDALSYINEALGDQPNNFRYLDLKNKILAN